MLKGDCLEAPLRCCCLHCEVADRLTCAEPGLLRLVLREQPLSAEGQAPAARGGRGLSGLLPPPPAPRCPPARHWMEGVQSPQGAFGNFHVEGCDRREDCILQSPPSAAALPASRSITGGQSPAPAVPARLLQRRCRPSPSHRCRPSPPAPSSLQPNSLSPAAGSGGPTAAFLHLLPPPPIVCPSPASAGRDPSLTAPGQSPSLNVHPPTSTFDFWWVGGRISTGEQIFNTTARRQSLLTNPAQGRDRQQGKKTITQPNPFPTTSPTCQCSPLAQR